MVDYSKHEEFKLYLLNLDITEPIKYFEVVNNDRYATYYCYHLELDNSFVEKLNKYDLHCHKVIMPIKDTFIQMIQFQTIQNQGVTYGGEVMRANQSYIISYLKSKNLLTLITPNCKQGANGWDFLNEISRNQDFYFNEMKKKNIITELNDINVNYCNKINNLESKLLEQNDKNNKLENKYNELKSEHHSISTIKEDLENENKRYYEKVNNLENENKKQFDRINNFKEEYQRVWKIRNDLEVENAIIKDKLDIIKDDLSKKDKLNKRLVNLLTIYKYHELNNVQKYNYEEIKNRNKKLNNEFKRVAKLMKLNK